MITAETANIKEQEIQSLCVRYKDKKGEKKDRYSTTLTEKNLPENSRNTEIDACKKNSTGTGFVSQSSREKLKQVTFRSEKSERASEILVRLA